KTVDAQEHLGPRVQVMLLLNHAASELLSFLHQDRETQISSVHPAAIKLVVLMHANKLTVHPHLEELFPAPPPHMAVTRDQDGAALPEEPVEAPGDAVEHRRVAQDDQQLRTRLVLEID